jgi:hypothetical protein
MQSAECKQKRGITSPVFDVARRMNDWYSTHDSNRLEFKISLAV